MILLLALIFILIAGALIITITLGGTWLVVVTVIAALRQ